MNSLVLLIICVAILAAGYICYGGWLCKQWGVGESKTETPAHTMEDGVDYVPAKAPVLMGHHFSSIAGAGPITGPIGAAMFGWLPVTLWILVGGIFFGGVHDFGALFASVRNKGQSIGEIISANMSKRAKQLFIIFSYLTLILVVAAFASIVASTFGAVYDESGALDMAKSATPATVAMISLLFILIAIVFGFCVYRRNMPMGIASVVGVLAIILIMAVGMNFHPIYLSTKTWMWIVGIYIAGLGDYLELEIIVETEEEREGALQRIENVLVSLGYSMKDTTRHSYLSMLTNQTCAMEVAHEHYI